jgi:hypothetical protein
MNSCVVATLCLRSKEPERRRSVDRDLGCIGRSLRVLNVKQLVMLKRDVASIEDDLDGTGFLGIEKDDEGRRRSIGSDLDFTNAFVGRSKPKSPSSSSSSSTSTSSFQKIGSSGSSFPGRYMLNCRGRKEGFRRSGGMHADSTFLKSDGAPIVGRRALLRLLVKLMVLIDFGLDTRARLSASQVE